VGHWLADHLVSFFARYGYWTVFVGLLLESAGAPVPGETTLIAASVLARTKHQFNIFEIVLIGFIAAVIGDNLGFLVGSYGGRPLLDRFGKVLHINEQTIREGEEFFRRRGGRAVFFARFIAGLRVIAGPLAGMLKMPWKRFMLFNALGGFTWVAMIATLAYLFGNAIESFFRHASLVLLAGAALIFLYWWRKQK
jgi:membrane-associated protein